MAAVAHAVAGQSLQVEAWEGRLPGSNDRATRTEAHRIAASMQLREFAIQSGWTIVAEYVDHESSKVSDRVEFQRMFAAASSTSTAAESSVTR